jgi:hypothetical protein
MPVKVWGSWRKAINNKPSHFHLYGPARDCGRSGGPHITARLSFYSDGCLGQVFRLEYYPNCQRCRLLARV